MQTQQYINPANDLHQATWKRSASVRSSILQDLASKLLLEIPSIPGADDNAIRLGEGFHLHDELQRMEVDLIRHALAVAHGRQRRAASLLGIKPTTLNMKIKRFGIDIAGLQAAGEI